MDKLIFISVGGVFGTLMRYFVSMRIIAWLGQGFPYGTLTVNCIGCFLMGMLLGLPEGHSSLSPQIRFFVVTGFLGAFTTFSAYEYDIFILLQQGLQGKAIFYMFASVFLSFILLLAGYSITYMVSTFFKAT